MTYLRRLLCTPKGREALKKMRTLVRHWRSRTKQQLATLQKGHSANLVMEAGRPAAWRRAFIRCSHKLKHLTFLVDELAMGLLAHLDWLFMWIMPTSYILVCFWCFYHEKPYPGAPFATELPVLWLYKAAAGLLSVLSIAALYILCYSCEEWMRFRRLARAAAKMVHNEPASESVFMSHMRQKSFQQVSRANTRRNLLATVAPASGTTPRSGRAARVSPNLAVR